MLFPNDDFVPSRAIHNSDSAIWQHNFVAFPQVIIAQPSAPRAGSGRDSAEDCGGHADFSFHAT